MKAEKLPVNSAIWPHTGFYLARSQPKIKSGTLKNLCLAQKHTKRSHTHPSAEDIPHRSLVTENLQLCFCECDNSVYLRATNTHTNTRTFKHIYKRIGIQKKKRDSSFLVVCNASKQASHQPQPQSPTAGTWLHTRSQTDRRHTHTHTHTQ